MKKITALFLTVCIALLMSGCVLTEETSNSTIDSNVPTTSETDETSSKPDETKTPDTSKTDGTSATEKEDSSETTTTTTTKPSVSSKLKVHYIDVGQGDSIFIELPNNRSMLIDAGESKYFSTINSYIKSLGYNKINYIVATHPHADHIGAMASIIDEFDFDKFYMPNGSNSTATYERMLTALTNKNKKATRAKAGVNILNDGSLKIDVVAPVADKYNNLNDYSVVIKMTYGENSFLFTGDAEALSEGQIKADINVDVLKVGHHGSHSSTSQAFLNKVSPSIAVISCGEDNDYGHPHDVTMNRLESKNIKILRTDLNGNIIITSDGKNLTTSTVKNEFEKDDEKKDPQETTPPKEETKYILNTNTKKIHYEHCRYADDISEKNKAYTNDYDKAIADGYSPCGVCKPK